MTADEDDIAASLKILLGTAIGERLFHPRYGLDLSALLFEPMSTAMKTELLDRANIAIAIYEPRIELLSLDLETTAENEGQIGIAMEYRVRATNSRYNLVYPFNTLDSRGVQSIGISPL